MRRNGQLIVVGAGGHALSVADAAISSGWTIGGFYSPEGSGPASILGPILSELEAEHVLGRAFALGIGTNYSRELALRDITSRFPDAEIAPIIHKSAWVSPQATVYPGATVLAHAAVGPGSTVETGALLNTGASLDHEGILGNFASLGPGAKTGGHVTIGSRTMVGMQATILQGITVGNDVVVGAHSLVNKEVKSNSVTFGVPARVIRTRLIDDPYY